MRPSPLPTRRRYQRGNRPESLLGMECLPPSSAPPVPPQMPVRDQLVKQDHGPVDPEQRHQNKGKEAEQNEQL